MGNRIHAEQKIKCPAAVCGRRLGSRTAGSWPGNSWTSLSARKQDLLFQLALYDHDDHAAVLLAGRARGFCALIFPTLIFHGRGLISALQGCGVRAEQCDPGAYKIRTGAVPVRNRGSGHTAPTYIS